jgi:molybdate transport system substrate-binding protein
MMRAPRRLAACTVVVVAALAAACGSSGSSKSSKPSSPPTTSVTKLTGPLTVLAASSLTEGFDDVKDLLTATNPGLKLTFSYAGSQALVQQIEQGAPADLFASASSKNMQTLVADGLVLTPKTFARNTLEIAVAPGNPKHIAALADLERADVTLVLADPSVPVGDYALQAFAKAGLPAPHAKSLELDVKAALAKVTLGEADAVVVYVTDVNAAGPKVQGVAVPDADNVIATYPVAVVKASKNRVAAQAFVDNIVSGSGQYALQGRGFLPPS